MAIPQADFEQLVESIKQEVIEGVREEIAKLPASGGSGMSTAMLTAAFAEMSDALLEAIQKQLTNFKEELFSELGNNPAATTQAERLPAPTKEKKKLSSYW